MLVMAAYSVPLVSQGVRHITVRIHIGNDDVRLQPHRHGQIKQAYILLIDVVVFFTEPGPKMMRLPPFTPIRLGLRAWGLELGSVDEFHASASTSLSSSISQKGDP